jgi:hypothetical protein
MWSDRCNSDNRVRRSSICGGSSDWSDLGLLQKQVARNCNRHSNTHVRTGYRFPGPGWWPVLGNGRERLPTAAPVRAAPTTCSWSRSLAWVGGRLSPSRCFRLHRRTDRRHRTQAPTHSLSSDKLSSCTWSERSKTRDSGRYARFPRLGDPDRRSAWPDHRNNSLAPSNDRCALIVPANMSISRSRYHCKQAAEQPSELAKVRAVLEMEHNDREGRQDGPENCLSDA